MIYPQRGQMKFSGGKQSGVNVCAPDDWQLMVFTTTSPTCVPCELQETYKATRTVSTPTSNVPLPNEYQADKTWGHTESNAMIDTSFASCQIKSSRNYVYGRTASATTTAPQWKPKGKCIAWMWGDLWRPAERNPFRYSEWYDLNEATKDLIRHQSNGKERPVWFVVYEKECFQDIATAEASIRSFCHPSWQPGHQIKWMWADLIKAAKVNPARWSAWMNTDDVLTHMQRYQQTSPSRRVKISVCTRKLCDNTTSAIELLDSFLK